MSLYPVKILWITSANEWIAGDADINTTVIDPRSPKERDWATITATCSTSQSLTEKQSQTSLLIQLPLAFA